MEPITLTTERLILRTLEPGDADAVYEACQDPEIPRWTSVPSPYTRQNAADFTGPVSADGWADDSLYNFGAFTKSGGTLVVSVALVRLGHLAAPDHQAELGYWAVKEQRGRGYTPEAGREVCRWAFEDLGVERMEWFADAGNEGSRAVARKIGFVMEGTLRSKLVHNGTRRDTWTGSLLPSDLGLPTATPYVPYPG
ncbi:GNAT family N-acetyltransferase [Streptomyces sp. H10-C2]|uniref:GNAT family N-acetyltransferase n=1 Tax=unclassified Streptomyces TaxID=2593676 RepID=UPI0024B913CC|nr:MULTISPECIES: GNAT family N-acetyltransferase [unclassified Streptomyces]MDJ0345730.1 GNAT family N-acetyltransferase [Streptomyces sp. PH10-H1]MDJ0374577.1 GNAT family N-acetyltransferase [Streptomyces sp. H10-C2]